MQVLFQKRKKHNVLKYLTHKLEKVIESTNNINITKVLSLKSI